MPEVKFEKLSDTEYSLDVCGFVCPHPQLHCKKGMAKLNPGDTLTLMFDNPSSKETIMQMCEAAGDEIVGDTKEGNKIVLKIQKG